MRAGKETLRTLVRPAGFANSKADYLQALATFFVRQGDVKRLGRHSTAHLRESLLAVRGIGPETADSILLYLFERPVWIADAYAGRLLSRLNAAEHTAARQVELMSHWIRAGRTEDLQELHALIVAHGKRYCRARPVCDGCPLHVQCRHGNAALSDRH